MVELELWLSCPARRRRAGGSRKRADRGYAHTPLGTVRGIDCTIRTVRVSFPVDVPHPGDFRWYRGGLATIPLKGSDTVH